MADGQGTVSLAPENTVQGRLHGPWNTVSALALGATLWAMPTNAAEPASPTSTPATSTQTKVVPQTVYPDGTEDFDASPRTFERTYKDGEMRPPFGGEALFNGEELRLGNEISVDAFGKMSSDRQWYVHQSGHKTVVSARTFTYPELVELSDQDPIVDAMMLYGNSYNRWVKEFPGLPHIRGYSSDFGWNGYAFRPTGERPGRAYQLIVTDDGRLVPVKPRSSTDEQVWEKTGFMAGRWVQRAQRDSRIGETVVLYSDPEGKNVVVTNSPTGEEYLQGTTATGEVVYGKLVKVPYAGGTAYPEIRYFGFQGANLAAETPRSQNQLCIFYDDPSSNAPGDWRKEPLCPDIIPKEQLKKNPLLARDLGITEEQWKLWDTKYPDLNFVLRGQDGKIITFRTDNMFAFSYQFREPVEGLGNQARLWPRPKFTIYPRPETPEKGKGGNVYVTNVVICYGTCNFGDQLNNGRVIVIDPNKGTLADGGTSSGPDGGVSSNPDGGSLPATNSNPRTPEGVKDGGVSVDTSDPTSPPVSSSGPGFTHTIEGGNGAPTYHITVNGPIYGGNNGGGNNGPGGNKAPDTKVPDGPGGTPEPGSTPGPVAGTTPPATNGECKDGEGNKGTRGTGSARKLCFPDDSQQLLRKIIATQEYLDTKCPEELRKSTLREVFSYVLEQARRTRDSDALSQDQHNMDVLRYYMCVHHDNKALTEGKNPIFTKEEFQEFRDLTANLGFPTLAQGAPNTAKGALCGRPPSRRR